MLSKGEQDVESFSLAIKNLKKNLVVCEKCFNISETSPCNICSDLKRDTSKIIAVEEPLDVIALEKTGFDGLYHVLGGVISPIDGIGPENLRIKELLAKLKKSPPAGGVTELILATDPSLEGEATSMYIAKQIQKENLPLKVTRIARGLPVGSDLEYADEITLTRALEGRKEY